MTKRKRNNSEAVGDRFSDEETGHAMQPLDDKQPNVPEAVDVLEENREGCLVTDDNYQQPESSRSYSKGHTSRKNENSSDSEERPELRSQKSLDGEDSASDKGSVMEETNSHLFQELLDAVLKMKGADGRMMCELFLKLPPRQQYPEYYKVIKEPIDLKMIYSRFKNNVYASLDDIEKDLQLLIKNAHAFNEPGSQVYKDATTIRKLVSAKRQEIEHTLSGAKSSKRLRSKRATTQMSLAINALLSDTDDDDDMQTDTSQILDDEEYEKNNADQLEDDTDDPFLALYNFIRRYSDYSGRIVCDAFIRLPSRRAYPDYYEVIKNPIGLSRIGSNIKNGLYESLDTLTAEMSRCFENAKAFNETESMLYQDANTLQEVLQSRKMDIEKVSLEKGIDLTRPVKKASRPSDNTQSEDADVDTKDSLTATTLLSKRVIKKVVLSENEANALMKRTREMYDAVESYQDENGRFLSQLFVELPSADQYPDYYEIISEPTCLRMIDRNICEGRYWSEQQFLLDFEIMFENAKHYNEVGSQVHQDALTLDKVLKKKRKSLGRIQLGQVEIGSSASPLIKQATPGTKQTTPTKSTRSFSSVRSSQAAGTSDVKELCKELFNSAKDYTDITGRYLCGIFQKLPSKNDYPDYYSLIKRPIDMSKISTKVHVEQYNTSEECFQDFVLMFDNACKYNDPDSQVYKDSLVLLRELLATKLELLGDCEMQVPDVPELVQKIMEELYDAVIHNQDEDGRCYSDSLMHLPNCQVVDESGQKKNVLSLVTIGKLVKKKFYKRLDKFQEDLFAFFEKARANPHNSEIYDDAVDLQQVFVQQRDRICKEGERFVSPAISQTKRHLAHELDEERKRKVKEEASELMESESNEGNAKEPGEEGDSAELSEINIGDQDITVGDYVNVDAGSDRFIVEVEKIWMDKEQTKWIRGPWFYRPEQTIHDATRKFIKKEVLRSDKNIPVNINQIKGLCYVMYVRNYITSKPWDFDERDVFVCECSYNSSLKSFKKIKGWSSHTLKHVAREQPFVLDRTPLHSEKATLASQAVKEDDEELIATLCPSAEENKNLQIDVPNPDGFVTYEQYCVDSGCYKLGDSVYSRTDEGYWTISRIDKIWSDRQGVVYFSGTTFIKPDDTQHLPTHMFHDKEVFHVPTDEVHRMNEIVRKCCVLPIREYMRCRPTDVAEEHVYLCESRYEEDDGGHFRKLKGLKRPTLSTNVYEEEYYFFEDNLHLVKKPSPLLVRDMSQLKRDDRMPSPAVAGADAESGKAAKKKSRAQSGFLLFSAERRNAIRKQNPDYSFGDISRIVGAEWKNLNPSKREEWESRGSFQAAKAIAGASPSAYSTGANGTAYDCLWQGCNYQYEDLNELLIHALESGGHLIKLENGICPCLWRNCERLKRGLRPFTSLTKLIRHCREIHLKGPPRRVEFLERSKNYFPKNQAPPQPEPLSPNPPPVSQPQQPGNPAYVGVVPSPTSSHVLGSTQSVNINLMNPQYSNVMRLPTPGLAQTMMGMSSSFGSAGVPALTSQNTGNIQRPGNVVNGSTALTNINQFGHIPAMGATVSQQQFTNSIPQFSSSYQQQQPQEPQQVIQLPPLYPNVQGMQQSLQQPTHLPQPRQTTPLQIDQCQQPQQNVLPVQRAQFMESQSVETQMTPLFHSPPPRQQKLLHSDAYLRYIEGLRDGTSHLSNWNPNKPDINKMTPQQQAQMPAQWLGTAYNPYPSTVDALWALREHMLNDALKLSKFSQNHT